MSLRRCARAVAVLACLSTTTLAPALWAQGATVETASEEQKKTASEKFTEGMAAQKKGDHESALTAFRASYDAVASPNSHLMVARELAELGRLDEAYTEYEKTVAEADAAATTDKKYAQTAKAAKKEYQDVRTKIALLIVNVEGGSPGDRVTLNGKELDRSQLGKAMPVMPGTARVEVTTSTGKEVSQEVNAEAGGSPTVTLTVPAGGGGPIAEEGGSEEASGEAKLDSNTSLRTWAYVAGGVGVVGLVAAGVFTILNNSKHSKLEDECSNNICPKSLEEDKDSGQTYQTLAQVGLGVGIVGLAAGTVLFILSSDSKEQTAQQKRSKPPAPRIDVGVGPRWVSVNGTF